MEEIWKDIQGYEGLYQVSNLGRVKSLGNNKTRKEKILKPRKEKNGYLRISLYQDKKMKNFLIHRLVAQVFISNINNLPDINHKDENKENNCVSNIEYCTRSYNVNYGTRIERFRKAKSIPVVQLTKTGEYIATHQSATQVQKKFGFHHSYITKCCKGKVNSAYKHKWCYLKDMKFLSELPVVSRKEKILQK